MSNRLAFQTQLASIMEVLANAAVAEICKLVDDDYAVMTLQMSQCQRENKALKRKLHLLELRMARGFAERRIRESSLNRSSRVQVTASLPDKYRDFSRAPAGGIFPGRDQLYGRQLNEDLWREREPPATDVAIDRPVHKDTETVTEDNGPEAVLVKAETSDEGNKQPELFIREDGVAEPIPEGGEAGYGAAQMEKADGHHSRTRRQALEPQKTEDEEPDVLFIKEEHSEQERRDSQTHGGMSVQDGFVESSTDICRSGTSSSPAQITIALGAEESEELDSSLIKESSAEQEKKTVSNQSAGVQISIQNVVGAQTAASLHSRDPALPHRGGGTAAAQPIGVKTWDLPSTQESQLQVGGESISNPLSNQSTQRRKMAMSADFLGANNTLFERPGEVEALFTRWTANNSSASQPSCSYVVDADQDQDCVLVQPAALSGIDGGSSNRLQEARGPIAVDEEWTTAAISQQTQQLSHYSRTDGVRLEQSNRVNVSQTVSKVTMNSQMLTSFSQAGYSLAGLQMPKRLEKGKRKSYICKYCGKAFTGLSNVEAHQRVHTGEKPFKCETCGKLFAEAGNLKKHQRVHTGEKPFTCTRCGKRFAWICNLRTHQQSASCGGV
ncbi:transcription factor Sp1 isoform X1 [Astyanax mexicanus]|uniref:transcription factor Sp1 isoform X1 n=1 Tax=Astyanax mexicanus TaxID=7994 RepID=UPI0020CB4EC9|nr:transcription factor Sp1 isoform X1 [Astyanax mexicanus]